MNQRLAVGALAVAAWEASLHTGEFALDIYDRLQNDNRLARCVATMCVDHGVTNTIVVSPDGGLELPREKMPAVQRLRQDREEVALLQANENHEMLTDENGNILVTEDGEPLVVERSKVDPDHANRRLAEVGSKWISIPRASLPKTEPVIEGDFVGTFEFTNPPFYTFRSATGEIFEVRGIDMQTELPTGLRLIVHGIVADSGGREALFYPARIKRKGVS